MRDDGKPALIFSAHLANWELPPLVAPPRLDTPCSTGGRTTRFSDAIIQTRSADGEAGADRSRVPLKLPA